MNSSAILRLQSVSPFTPRSREATPDLLPPLKRRRLRQPSPHRRIADPFHLWLIGSTYRPFGRRRASPVMSQDHFLQAAARTTRVVHTRHSASTEIGAGIGSPSALHRGAVTGAPRRPKCRLPESPCLAPSSRRLLRSFRWRRAGCVPSRQCEVRARCSVRVRSRTGRLWRVVILLSSPHPFLLR